MIQRFISFLLLAILLPIAPVMGQALPDAAPSDPAEITIRSQTASAVIFRHANGNFYIRCNWQRTGLDFEKTLRLVLSKIHWRNDPEGPRSERSIRWAMLLSGGSIAGILEFPRPPRFANSAYRLWLITDDMHKQLMNFRLSQNGFPARGSASREQSSTETVSLDEPDDFTAAFGSGRESETAYQISDQNEFSEADVAASSFSDLEPFSESALPGPAEDEEMFETFQEPNSTTSTTLFLSPSDREESHTTHGIDATTDKSPMAMVE